VVFFLVVSCGAVDRDALSRRQAAAHYGVGISTAIKWVQRLRRTGSVRPDEIGGYRPKKLSGPWRTWLLEVWRLHAAWLSCRTGGARPGPDVARRRAQWLHYRHRIDPSHRVFIDETWTKTNMATLRGWTSRGERLKAKVPHRRWKTMTFLAALRLDRVEAPWLIDGPSNGERFRLYVEKVLLPTLQPDDIVVLDTSAATAARRSVVSSTRWAPGCSSCQNTPPTSTPSSSCSQS
jgi:hypothetical protein